MEKQELLQKVASIPHLDLGIEFNVERLESEYKALEPEMFRGYNSSVPEIRNLIAASWQGLSLLSPDGSLHNDLSEDRHFYEKTMFRTEAAERCPYMMEVINELSEENTRIRLMKVMPGGRLSWHSHQYDLADYRPENIVVHVPIVSPEKFRYSIINIKQFRFGDFENEGLTIHSKNYEAGKATMLNCTHMHNVFNDDVIPRVSIMMYLSLNCEKTKEIVEKAVKDYKGIYLN